MEKWLVRDLVEFAILLTILVIVSIFCDIFVVCILAEIFGVLMVAETLFPIILQFYKSRRKKI